MLIGSKSLLAQSVTTDTLAVVTGKRLEVEWTYMNPVTYRGRTFGIRQSGQIPTLRYWSNTGWQVYGAAYLWRDADARSPYWGKTDLGIAKDGHIGSWDYSLGYEHWFWRWDVEGRRALTNFSQLYVSSDLDGWTPAIGVYYMFGQEQLLQTDLTLARVISLVENHRWLVQLEPGVWVIFANQTPTLNAVLSKHTNRLRTDLRKRGFGLVDVEMDCPLSFKTRRINLQVDPHLAQPVRTLAGENKNAFFYLTASLLYAIPLR